MRRVVIADSAEKMQEMRPAWEHLCRQGNHTIFQSYEWNELAARYFHDREIPFVVMVESDSGLAIIPAAINVRSKQLTLLGETLFDYRDVLSTGDDLALDAAWAEVLSVALREELTFKMHSLREKASAHEKGVWRGFDLKLFTHAPCVRRNEEAAGHTRLGRNLRRLLKLGCELKRYSGAESAVVKRIYELKALEGDSLFRDPLRVAMLTAMANSNPQACDVFTLESGSTIVTALVTFVDGNWRRLYTTYHTVDEKWAKHSPGLTLIHFAMKDAVASGLDCDFMTGDQPYKRRLAISAVPLYRVSASAEALADRLRSGLVLRAA